MRGSPCKTDPSSEQCVVGLYLLDDGVHHHDQHEAEQALVQAGSGRQAGIEGLGDAAEHIGINDVRGFIQQSVFAHKLEEQIELAVASAEDVVIRKTDLQTLLEKIKSLPEDSREILQLRIIGGLHFREIGEILGHTETWSRVNYYRIKQTIAKELMQYEE